MGNDVSWCPRTCKSYIECVSTGLHTLVRENYQGHSQICILGLVLALMLGILTQAAKTMWICPLETDSC